MTKKDTIALEAQTRTETGRAVRKVAQSRIPAVVYGKDCETQNIWVDAVAFSRVFTHAGTNMIVSLKIDKKPVDVLIYELQTDPVTNQCTHIDFYIVDMKEKVEAEIPLTFTGVSAAVKELGGTLIKNYDEVLVSALPGDLPGDITVDVTSLKTFDDNIAVSDLSVEGDVEIMMDNDTIIASVSAPRSEEELAALDDAVDADVSQVEGVADKEPEEGAENKEGEKEEK